MDISDYVLAFEEEWGRNGEQDPLDWCNNWRGEEAHAELLRLLLQVGCELCDLNLTWLKLQLSRPRMSIGQTDIIGILRYIFLLQAEIGTVESKIFEQFCICAEDLNLRLDHDGYSLGAVIFDRYRIDGRIASGGIATTYRVVELESGRTFLAKASKLCDEQDTSDKFKKLIRHEASVMQSLVLPGIPKFCEICENRWCATIIMEFVEGVSLSTWIDKNQSRQSVLRLIATVARTIDLIHQADFTHGDIKASNVVVRPDDTPVVIDFNAAEFIGFDRDRFRRLQTGTIANMNIRSLRREISDRQDIHALGTLLVRLWTGRDFLNPTSVRDAIWQLSFIDNQLNELQFGEMTESVRRLCYMAMSNKYSDWIETAGEFAEACERLAAGEILAKSCRTGTPI